MTANSSAQDNSTPHTSLSDRLGKHFAAAAACAVVAGSAASTQAAVIHSGTVNLNLPATTNGLYLNVLNGVNSSTPAGAPGWDVNPWSSTGFGLFNPASPAGGVYVITSANNAANLASGTVIDGTKSYGSSTSTSTSQWALNSADNLIGFRFTNENTSQVHYGWMRVAFGATITSRTLVEYAYDDTPGAAIQAGVIPEPASLTLLGAGAFCFLRRRR